MFQLGIIVFVTLGLAVITDAKCPPKFEEYNMACHYFGTNTVANIGEAYMVCSNLGGYLLNINAKAEYDYIVKRLENNPASYYWTGGQRTGQWRWIKKDRNGNTEVNIIDRNQLNQYSCKHNSNGNNPKNNLALVRSWQSCIEPLNEYTTGLSYICEADWDDAW